MKKAFLFSVVALFSLVTLFITIKGNNTSPTQEDLSSSYWKENGPFELSPERGRFSLTYSLVENRSLSFSLPLAKFVAPDVAYSNGRYVSLFAPGLSYIVIPGYLIGKAIGISQVGTFAMISMFGFFNLILIAGIVSKLSKSYLAGFISGLIFLFATPAYPYAGTLYQHHITTFLVLASIRLLVSSESIFAIGAVLFLCAVSIPLDSPNAIFLLPIALYALSRLVKVESLPERILLRLRYLGVFSILFALIPIFLLLVFNIHDHNDAFKLSGTLSAVKVIDESGNPVSSSTGVAETDLSSFDEKAKGKTTTGFFKTRNLLNGFYIHLFSPDRGVIFFAPVVLFGFVGMFKVSRKYRGISAVMIGTAGVIFLLYSLWGDPWGGWAFGDRYMIPGYALLCIFVGIGLSTITKRFLLTLLFTGAIVYSLSVNALGALTTHAVPPAVEAIGLEKITGRVEKYSYDRNWDYINLQGSKSYFYRTFLSTSISARDFYLVLVSTNTIFILSLLVSYIWSTRKLSI